MFVFVRCSLITGLWVLSFAMITVRTVINDNPALAVLSTWSIHVALLACVVTGWHLLIRERHRVETVARIAATEAVGVQRDLALVE